MGRTAAGTSVESVRGTAIASRAEVSALQGRHARAVPRPERVVIFPPASGAVAQLGEHLLCKQGVVGSSPIRSIDPIGRPATTTPPGQATPMRSFRFLAAVIVVLALGACGGAMSVEEAREADIVAVNGVTLDGATLERLLLSAPSQVPPGVEAASVYVSAFIDAALLRQALVRGTPITDSAIVMRAIMPDAVRGQILTLLQQRKEILPAVTDAQADSLARLGAVRVFQHILFRIEDPQDTATVTAALRRLEGIAAELGGGADFATMAQRVSEDSATGPSGGYLPALTRRELPQGRLADFAWALQPGEISQVVGSPAGIHILRRVPTVDARPALKEWLVPRLARRADSLWADSLTSARQLTLGDNVPERLREMAVEPFRGGGDAPFATWQGGDLSAEEVRSWIGVMPVVERATLPFTSDSAANLMVTQLAEREIVFEAASPQGERVTPAAWEALAPQYRQVIAAMIEQYRDALVVGDSSAAVRQFVSDLTSGGLPYRPMPGALGHVLRSDADITINQPALDAIIRSASEQWETRNDTTGAATPQP